MVEWRHVFDTVLFRFIGDQQQGGNQLETFGFGSIVDERETVK